MTFKINGTALTFITGAQWDFKNSTGKLDGQTAVNNFQQHTWGTNVMTEPEFNTLFALQGEKVTIETIDYDTLSSFTTYPADFESITATHEGENFVGVSLRFLVSITPPFMTLDPPVSFALFDGGGNPLVDEFGDPLFFTP